MNRWEGVRLEGTGEGGLTDRGFVNREDICWVIVEAVAKFEVKAHGGSAVVAVERDLAWTSVFEASLSPGVKDITQYENCLGGVNGFNCILAVEAELPVGGAVQQCKGKVTSSSSSATIVDSGVLPTDGH